MTAIAATILALEATGFAVSFTENYIKHREAALSKAKEEKRDSKVSDVDDNKEPPVWESLKFALTNAAEYMWRGATPYKVPRMIKNFGMHGEVDPIKQVPNVPEVEASVPSRERIAEGLLSSDAVKPEDKEVFKTTETQPPNPGNYQPIKRLNRKNDLDNPDPENELENPDLGNETLASSTATNNQRLESREDDDKKREEFKVKDPRLDPRVDDLVRSL